MMDLRNVILITADAWRADFADSFGGVPLLPSWSQFADHTSRFTRAYATAPWTSPAVVSLLTGASSLNHGVHYAWSTPPADGPALASIAQQRGHATPNLSYLNVAENYHNLGYQPAAAPEGSAPEILLRAIADTPAPYFLWFHYKGTHLPYWASPAHRDLFGVPDARVPAEIRETVGSCFVLPRADHTLDPAHTEVVRALYAASVREMDDWLGKVLDAVAARGHLDRTSIFLTSDHGEELMERGHVGHASTAEHATLFEEVLRVPLFVYDARTESTVCDAPLQGDDIFHGIVDTLGGAPAEAPKGPVASVLASARGDASLGPAVRDRPLLFHSARAGYRTPREWTDHTISAAIQGRHKVIVERYGAQRMLAFDLQVDPGETHPLSISEPAEVLLELLGVRA